MTQGLFTWDGPMPRQCKDIPDLPVVQFITLMDGAWGTWCWSDKRDMTNSVAPLFPADIPDKLLLAKMGSLIRRGLIDGCPCGCRGDYEATDKGRAFVAERLAAGDQGCSAEMASRAVFEADDRRRRLGLYGL